MQICYHGPTSAVHDPPPDVGTWRQPSISTPSAITTATPLSTETSREMERFALGNVSLWSGIPRDVLADLLRLHWTWIAPMFLWVYRPAFMRKYQLHTTL
jgi:hypothetical protein